MKIAVTYEKSQVFQHFGKTEEFKIYEITEGKVVSEEVISTEGNGHGALAGFLKDKGICVLICGGLGGGAKSALEAQGIEVYAGVEGDADKAAADYTTGKLDYNRQAECHHHDHQHGDHVCGESHQCKCH